jgi:hypothetical protein
MYIVTEAGALRNAAAERESEATRHRQRAEKIEMALIMVRYYAETSIINYIKKRHFFSD